jgi:ABC-type uncharacterized transport system permease subunit
MDDAVLLVGFVAATLRFTTPILLAALGETVAQRAGVFNVGIEGIMLVSAFVAVLGAIWTGSPYGGLLAAILAGVAMSAIHAFFSVTLKVDQIVSGIALIALGAGLSGFGYRLTIGAAASPPPVPSFSTLDLGWLTGLPYIGKALFSAHLLVYVSFLAVLVMVWFFYRTRWGLELRAVGEAPAAADAAGINVDRYRFGAILFGGGMAGVGGAYLATAQLSGFVEGMVAGRGFIAIACVVFGRWNPAGVLLAALFFGAAEAAQIRLQSLIPGVPYQVFTMLPYVLAVVALVILAGKSRMPGGLGTPYFSDRAGRVGKARGRSS